MLTLPSLALAPREGLPGLGTWRALQLCRRGDGVSEEVATGLSPREGQGWQGGALFAAGHSEVAPSPLPFSVPGYCPAIQPPPYHSLHPHTCTLFCPRAWS